MAGHEFDLPGLHESEDAQAASVDLQKDVVGLESELERVKAQAVELTNTVEMHRQSAEGTTELLAVART